MKIPTPFFDPDRNVFAQDKLEHAGAMLVLAYLLLLIGFGWLATLFIVLLVASAFELGQWDIGRQDAELHTNPADLTSPFMPGYGFGLLDLAAGMVGALVAILVRAIL